MSNAQRAHKLFQAGGGGLFQSLKKHPETLRWVGRLNGLLLRHKAQVAEMEKRGWRQSRSSGLSINLS